MKNLRKTPIGWFDSKQDVIRQIVFLENTDGSWNGKASALYQVVYVAEVDRCVINGRFYYRENDWLPSWVQMA
jgi:hypothetical protein